MGLGVVSQDIEWQHAPLLTIDNMYGESLVGVIHQANVHSGLGLARVSLLGGQDHRADFLNRSVWTRFWGAT